MILDIKYRPALKSDHNFLLDLRIQTMNPHLIASSLPVSDEAHLQRIEYQFEHATIIEINKRAIGLLKVHIETYSFQRGDEYNAVIQMLKPERHTLKVRKEKRNNLTDTEEIRLNELDALLGVTQYLIDGTGRFHFSSQITNTFQCGHEVICLLKSILLTKTADVNNWMCAPIYRDAIVFYKSSGELYLL